VKTHNKGGVLFMSFSTKDQQVQKTHNKGGVLFMSFSTKDQQVQKRICQKATQKSSQLH
jgi:hypothetical protein